MITLENVSKYFPTPNGRHYVLQDVSVEIPAGAKVAVLGLNGAGKSTLMRLLAGVDIPNSGKIIRRGNISWPMGLASCLQKTMSGEENTKFACRVQGITGSDMKRVVQSVKDFSEIGDYFYLPVNSYSSGMRARLQFGIAMAFDFDCYLIDELTAVGDQTFRNKSDLVFKQKRQNAAFIKVSHNLGELIRDCDSALMLHDGNLTYYPSMVDAAQAYQAIIGKQEKRQMIRQRRKLERQGLEGDVVDAMAPMPNIPTREERLARRAARDQRRAAKAARRRQKEQRGSDGKQREGVDSAVAAVRDQRKKQRREQRQLAKRVRASRSRNHTPAPMAPRVRRTAT